MTGVTKAADDMLRVKFRYSKRQAQLVVVGTVAVSREFLAQQDAVLAEPGP